MIINYIKSASAQEGEDGKGERVDGAEYTLSGENGNRTKGGVNIYEDPTDSFSYSLRFCLWLKKTIASRHLDSGPSFMQKSGLKDTLLV